MFFGLAADVGLIDFNLSVHFAEEPVVRLHGQPDTMEHEPSGFLGNAEIAGQFVGADPVLAVHQHPHGRQPQGQLDRGVLEDRTDLDGELLPAVPALPDPAGLEEVVLANASALRAGLLTGGPAKVGDESQCNVLVCEVLDGFKQSLGSIVLSVHKEEYTPKSWVCQVCYCPNKRLLQSRKDVAGSKHSPCGSRLGSPCWPRSRIAETSVRQCGNLGVGGAA